MFGSKDPYKNKEKLPLKDIIRENKNGEIQLKPNIVELLKNNEISVKLYESYLSDQKSKPKQPEEQINPVVGLSKKDQELKDSLKEQLPEIILDYLKKADPKINAPDVLGEAENVSTFLPLTEHANEYKGSAEMRNTIMELMETKPVFRRIKGDGNCFFRAAVIQYYESLLQEEIKLSKRAISKSKLMTFMKEIFDGELIKCKLNTENYELKILLTKTKELKEILCKTSCEILLEKLFLDQKYGDKAFPHLLEFVKNKINRTPGFDVALIVFIRSWIFKAYKDHYEEYKNFVFDNSTEDILQTYCEEGQNIVIPIAADALKCKVAINMVHKDYNKNQVTLKVEEYPGILTDNGEGDNKPVLNMYFRPGHYEILYDRKFYKKFLKTSPGLENL